MRCVRPQRTVGRAVLVHQGQPRCHRRWGDCRVRECFPSLLNEQTRAFSGGGRIANASYAIEYGDALFCFFDAYDSESLDWLEASLVKRTAKHCFIVIHPPIVPYGAVQAGTSTPAQRPNQTGEADRSIRTGKCLGNWWPSAQVQRDSSHDIARRAIWSSFCQQCDQHPKVQPKDLAEARIVQCRPDSRGAELFSGHGKGTASDLEAERPFVKAFQYADHPGYAVVTVSPESVKMSVYSGVSRQAWTTLNLSELVFS